MAVGSGRGRFPAPIRDRTPIQTTVTGRTATCYMYCPPIASSPTITGTARLADIGQARLPVDPDQLPPRSHHLGNNCVLIRSDQIKQRVTELKERAWAKRETEPLGAVDGFPARGSAGITLGADDNCGPGVSRAI